MNTATDWPEEDIYIEKIEYENYRLEAENERLRAALEQIVATERDDDSICAADRCASIARAALNEEKT